MVVDTWEEEEVEGGLSVCVGETGLANVDGLKLDDDEEAGAAGAEVVDKA